MAVTLKTEFGEFTGETVKEAEKLARKAEREATKEQRAANRNNREALSKARERAYLLMDAARVGEMSGYTYFPAETRPALCGLIVTPEGTFVTADDLKGKLDCGPILGHVENSVGDVRMIVTQDGKGHAVGIHNETVALALTWNVWGVPTNDIPVYRAPAPPTVEVPADAVQPAPATATAAS